MSRLGLCVDPHFIYGEEVFKPQCASRLPEKLVKRADSQAIPREFDSGDLGGAQVPALLSPAGDSDTGRLQIPL